MAMAMATVMAMAAAAVIRPEHAEGGRNHENRPLLKNAVLGLFWSFWDLLDLKNGSGSKFRVEWYYREVWKSKIKPFHGKSMVRRGAVGAGSESKPKQKQTHPKQNRFKPGRWVGLNPFAPIIMKQ